MEQTKIEWTATYSEDGTVIPGYTFNPWIGCTKVSDGCKYCYAENLMDKRYGRVEWGPTGTRARTSNAYWRKPLQWDRKCEEAGIRQRVFCASLADVFEDNDQVIDWRLDLFRLIKQTPNLDWLLLTKRPGNIKKMTEFVFRENGRYQLPDNVAIGVSVENQETANERIPHLAAIPAKVRFLSIEPLLGAIDLEPLILEIAMPPDSVPINYRWFIPRPEYERSVDWVIVGGESGPSARPMHPRWVWSIRMLCCAADIPFFFKQHGEWLPEAPITSNAGFTLQAKRWVAVDVDGTVVDYDNPGAVNALSDGAWFMGRVGKKKAGRLLDGREWNEMPFSMETDSGQHYDKVSNEDKS